MLPDVYQQDLTGKFGPAMALDGNATTYALPGASATTYTTTAEAFATAMQVRR